jgi:hypothetical protein
MYETTYGTHPIRGVFPMFLPAIPAPPQEDSLAVRLVSVVMWRGRCLQHLVPPPLHVC